MTRKCFTGAFSIDKIYNALFLHFYFSATWPSSNELVELGIDRTRNVLHLRVLLQNCVWDFGISL